MALISPSECAFLTSRASQVLFYAPLLFQQAGLDPSTSSFIASGCTGLVLVACVFAGTFYIEKVGRRKIWMVGGTGTSVCLFTLGFLYATGAAHTPVGKYAAIIFIELFAVCFTSSWSLITKLCASRIIALPLSQTRLLIRCFPQMPLKSSLCALALQQHRPGKLSIRQ